MSVTATELIQYGAASRPEDDTSTVGGAIDTQSRPFDAELASASDVEALSDGADARTLTITYRLASGATSSGIITLNGTTPVALGVAIERILKAVLSASNGSRTVTLRVVSAGATLHTFNPNETTGFRNFIKAVSSGSTKTYYEKTHWKNTNASLALLNGILKLTADPSTKIKIGLATAVNDSVTTANRLTAPGSVVFVDDNVDQNVPGTDLAPTASIGVWAELSLAVNNSALKSSFTTELRGQSA